MIIWKQVVTKAYNFAKRIRFWFIVCLVSH